MYRIKLRCVRGYSANLLVESSKSATDNRYSFSGISYNQPRICPSAVWNSSGKIFINRTSFGGRPGNIFIDVTNATYVISRDSGLVRTWSAGATTSFRNLSAPFNKVSSVFVTSNADMYASSGNDGRVVKWGWNATNSRLILTASSICYSIFVDINNTLYCSIEIQHQIMKYFLDDNNNNNMNNTPIIAAGNRSPGSRSDMLNSPKGIFVSTSFNLYVADCGNDRIQQFTPGNLNATTLFKNGSSATITLNCPTGVVLDADNYLFIADGNNHRIIREGPNGFQCIIACSSVYGLTSDKLNYPKNLAFDSFGNLFVVDQNNDRIQKFILIAEPCSKY